ncbi:MAG: hypothetical protein R3266_04130, partial [Gemmatimonadota bacterium]|nr:hypothetical protein [Gemmatimonadota bacterium]
MNRDPGRRHAALTTLAAGLLGAVPALLGQDVPRTSAADEPGEGAPPSGWNAPPALRLIEGAIEARRHAYADSSLRSFRARAQGHIYFLGEFRGQREVIRADQIALDVRWQAPDRALQTIVGRRHEVRLPTDIRYHIDHLSLVLDNFGDRIRLGDGDEVWNVLHPAAEGATEVYDYRLVRSFTIGLRNRDADVDELAVRPRDPRSPAVVGSVFIERETGAIARMKLTFTRASYRDPELVGIVLDLRSGLWEGRYWLPAEQDLEIRRSLSWLDFPIETVIRTRLEVVDYELDGAPGMRLAPGERVATLPDGALAAFSDWRAPLYGGPLEAGDRSDRDLSRTLREARRLVSQRSLAGGERLKLSLPDASSGLRARRAEGALVGAGGSYAIDDRTRVIGWGGYATSSERPEAMARLERESGPWTASLEARLRSLSDVGFPAASGAIRTLGFVWDGDDYTDPYFENGVRLAAARPAGRGRFEVGASILGQRSAELVAAGGLFGDPVARPVRRIDEGELFALDAEASLPLGRSLGLRWRVDLEGEAGAGVPDGQGFVRGLVRIRAELEGLASPWAGSMELALGAGAGHLPAQRLFLLGGRGTLPGYAFRPWGGDRIALWRGEVSRSVWRPWLRVRALGAAGRVDLGDAGGPAAARFGAVASGGWRASAGAGVGLFHDILRIDAVRGLDVPERLEGELLSGPGVHLAVAHLVEQPGELGDVLAVHAGLDGGG